MANNSNKKPNSSVNGTGFKTKTKRTSAPDVKNTAEAAKSDKLTKKQLIILVAVALVAVIISGVIIGSVIMSKKTNNPDFLTDNLSKYITISEEDYKGYTIDIPIDSFSDVNLDNAINKLLVEHKKLNEDYNGGYVKNVPLSVGDIAFVYYRGYTVGEDGREVDFDGSSNFPSDPIGLEVGTGKTYSEGKETGSFILGFAESLLGIVPNEHEPFEKISEGNVLAGDVIYLSYTVMSESRNEMGITYERIDLSLPYIDELYGEGFCDKLIGKPIGEELEDFTLRKKGESTDTVYSDVSIDFVTRCESDPVTIEVTFPASYSEDSLKGAKAYFDIYVRYSEDYITPEFNDTFITETLKVTEQQLSSYEGATLTEKYKAKLTEELKTEIEESNHRLLEDEMWAHLFSRVKVKKLPKVTVETYYNVYYNELVSAYQNYQSSYDSIEKFAAAYYGLGANESYEDYITTLAEGAVTEKIIFYYIIREENLIPDTANYNRIYQKLYSEMLDYYLELHAEEFGKLEGEEYNKELQTLKDEIDSYYGEEYFRENVYYYYCTREMLKFASYAR